MEIFLNLLWVVIALALLGVWRVCWAVQLREREHACWRQWTAVACALIFLFFTVSLTDDLHSDLLIFEECSAGRRHATCLDCLHHSPQRHVAAAIHAILAAPDSTGILFCLGPAAPGYQAFRTACAPRRNSDRAPPVISL